SQERPAPHDVEAEEPDGDDDRSDQAGHDTFPQDRALGGRHLVRAIVCPPSSLGVASKSYAVVGVAQVRRQRGAVTDGTPRVGVAPGSAAADAPGPRGRTARIPSG